MSVPTALTIAGSDSSGAAGLQADLPTFAALGVHGTAAVTVVTAQNTLGIEAFHQLPAALVAQQLDAIVADLAPTATKTGLIRDAEALAVVAERRTSLGALVIDPVLAGSDGRPIVDDVMFASYRTLAASATVFTPNRWEAEILLGVEHLDADGIAAAAEQFRDLGAAVVVVTGGRGDEAMVRDVVITATSVDELSSQRLDAGGAIRGTGCTFSAAVTARLALGATAEDAVRDAHAFVQASLHRSSDPSWLRPGAGRPGVAHRRST